MVPASTDLVAARGLVRSASSIVVLTGAGISTDSGIPDFRGPNGVWTRNPKAEKLADIAHYVADPSIRRESWLRRLDSPAWRAEPNDGHRALVELEQNGRLSVLITQNIDGLHQIAGSDPSRIIEIHGTIRDVECLDCGWRDVMGPTLDRVRGGDPDPACLECGGILKSATISFGQSLVEADLLRAFQAAATCDLLVAVGSTLSVYPIAEVVPIARRSGADVIIVNGEATAMDHHATIVLQAQIAETLGTICS